MPEAREHKLLSADWAVAEVDQLFSRFARYTRFVVFSKWFLMLFAVALVTLLIALPLISKDRSGIRISFVDTASHPKQSATQPVMSNPEYRGTDASGQQFKVNGVRAVQMSQTQVHLEQVEAQMVSANGAWRSLTAAGADYDQTANTITLMGDVTLFDDKGYSFTTAKATLDTEHGSVVGHEQVTGEGPVGKLLASGFEIRDSGAHIVFSSSGTERVKLHIKRAAK